MQIYIFFLEKPKHRKEKWATPIRKHCPKYFIFLKITPFTWHLR